MMMSRYGIAARAAECERLDLALTREPFALSRREAKRVINAHRVAMNGRIVSVESRRVGANTRICVLNADTALNFLERRSDLLVVDKPAAVPTQPSPDDANPSLIEIAASILKRDGELDETFVIHRLDTNTTGVVLVGRTRAATERYSAAISGGESEKIYLAIVAGEIADDVTIDAPIGRVQGNLFGVLGAGKPARSHVKPRARSAGATLVEVQIETGRTHQIRIHLAHLGHPVLGDVKYGSGNDSRAARPMLHSWRLRVGAESWEAPVPEDFAAMATALGIAE